MISACAVGSEVAIGELHPRPTISPSITTTAPTGTSPFASAWRANSRASRMKAASLSGMYGGLDVHFHDLLHLQHKVTGVLHAPLHVRNGEVRGSGVLIARTLGLEMQREFVLRTVDFE